MADRNAVVYTPCLVADTGLHLFNFTLPENMVCSDILPDLGKGLMTEPCIIVLNLHMGALLRNVQVAAFC